MRARVQIFDKVGNLVACGVHDVLPGDLAVDVTVTPDGPGTVNVHVRVNNVVFEDAPPERHLHLVTDAEEFLGELDVQPPAPPWWERALIFLSKAWRRLV